jgi:glycerate kinase
MAWLNAQMRPGAAMVAELVALDQAMQSADLAFTGEGSMDAQTLQGKTPMGVIEVAQRHGVPVIALVGRLGDGYQSLYDVGLTAAFSLTNGPLELEQALTQAAPLLEARTADIMRTWLRAASAQTKHHSCE